MTEEVPKHPEIQQKKSKNKKWQIFLIALTLFLLTATFLFWLFGRKSYGNITVSPQKEEGMHTKEERQTLYEGKYTTFTYPSDFNRRTESETVKYPMLERVYLTQDDIAGRKIAVTVQDNAGYSLEEYSSYRIRATEPALYQQKTLEGGGIMATAFIKSGNGPEVVLFFEEKNRVVSIALSSLTTSEGLENDARILLESFRWTNK